MTTPYDVPTVVSVKVQSVGESKPGKDGKTSYVVKALVPGVGQHPTTLLVDKTQVPLGIRPGEHLVKLGVDRVKDGKDGSAPWDWWYKVIAWDVKPQAGDGSEERPYSTADAGEERPPARPLTFDQGKAIERRSIERQKALELAIRCLETGLDAMKALLLAELFSRHIRGDLADQDISDIEDRLISLGLIPAESPAMAPSVLQAAVAAPKPTPAPRKAAAVPLAQPVMATPEPQQGTPRYPDLASIPLDLPEVSPDGKVPSFWAYAIRIWGGTPPAQTRAEATARLRALLGEYPGRYQQGNNRTWRDVLVVAIQRSQARDARDATPDPVGIAEDEG